MSKRKKNGEDDIELVEVSAFDLTTDLKEGENVGQVKVLLNKSKMEEKTKEKKDIEKIVGKSEKSTENEDKTSNHRISSNVSVFPSMEASKKRIVFELWEWKVEHFEDRFKNYVCNEIDDHVHRTDDPEHWPFQKEWDVQLARNFYLLKSDEKINVVNEHDNLRCPFCDFGEANLENLLWHAWGKETETFEIEDEDGFSHYVLRKYIQQVKEYTSFLKYYSNGRDIIPRIV